MNNKSKVSKFLKREQAASMKDWRNQPSKTAPHTPCIKGAGFNHISGGFAVIYIDGKDYLPVDVALAVNSHDRLVKALEPFANGHIDVSETAVILGYGRTQAALGEARAALAAAQP